MKIIMRAPMLQRRQCESSSKKKLGASCKTKRENVANNEIAYTVSYIAEMTHGLVPFAKSSNFEFISYLLELARCEAERYLRDPLESSSDAQDSGLCQP